MILYDALRDTYTPSILRGPSHRGRLLRAVYDHRGPFSTLTAAHRTDGVHLMLWGAPGYSIERVADPQHHHISRLAERVQEYAALFPTTTFVIEAPRSPEFMQARLPDWTPVGYVRDGVYRMEYHLP